MARLEIILRSVVVIALIVDAVVHFRLAENMQLAAPDGIGGGTLFRAQAIAAVLAAVLLGITGVRVAYLLAAAAALSAFVPVMLYSFIEVPAIGPIPSMYDPSWYPLKTLSAVAEGLGVALAVLGATLTPRRLRKRPAPGQ